MSFSDHRVRNDDDDVGETGTLDCDFDGVGEGVEEEFVARNTRMRFGAGSVSVIPLRIVAPAGLDCRLVGESGVSVVSFRFLQCVGVDVEVDFEMAVPTRMGTEAGITVAGVIILAV